MPYASDPRYRPEHPIALGCCEAPAAAHRKRIRARPEHVYVSGCCPAPEPAHRERERPQKRDYILGLDGEGVGRRPHRYVYLAASDADGRTWDARNPEGLDTEECLDLILSLPSRALIIGFSLGYDWTMVLGDLPDRDLWRLYHETARAELDEDSGRIVYHAVKWRGYRLNQMNRRFTVAYGKTTRTVWDFFRFFQCSFVKAARQWGYGAELDEIERMKSQRSTFAKLDAAEIESYCRSECRILADLGRKVLDAHEDAGISLRAYNGPGSSAAVLLDRMGIADKRGEIPRAMRHAVACAYFGGRFECCRLGPVAGDVWSYDLASAYPYAAMGLPCIVCGRWRLVAKPSLKTLRSARLALVHWQGGKTGGQWGALPMRDARGSIVFPLWGAGGWAWGREFLAARELAGRGLRAVEAWIYESKCSCPPPFAELGQWYRERVRWGKEGAGRALKLAINSVYGKLAQSAGLSPPYQSWTWAGIITSDTRAELLRAIAAAPSDGDVVMLATDGLYSTSRLELRAPRDTGTSDLPVPLGAWEEKQVPGGIFCVRPGVYFPLRADAGADDVKARGIGRAVMVEHRQRIADAVARGDESVTIDGFERFVGAKSAITTDAERREFRRRDEYGEWVPWSLNLRFDPRPKRSGLGEGGVLVPWRRLAWESHPYDAATVSPEADVLAFAEEILAEQPDGEFSRA